MLDPISLALHPPRFSKGNIRLATRIAPTTPFQWPLERFGSRDAKVLAVHVDGDRQGIDLGYSPMTYDLDLFVPVYAANDGEVSLALGASTGCSVSLDHGRWCTHYAHLSKMFVTSCLPRLRRRQHVRRGEVIGYAAKAPVHVRFELWQWTDEYGFVSVDPIAQLKDWTKAPPMPIELPSSNQQAA